MLKSIEINGGNFLGEMIWKEVSWCGYIVRGPLYMFYIVALTQIGETDIYLGVNMNAGETGYFKLEK